MNLGIGLGLSFSSAPRPGTINPLSLSPTGYWVDYAGAPWANAGSAGNSFGASTGTVSVGASFGSHPSADFDGGDDMIGTGLTFGALLSASAFTVQCIAQFDTLGAPTGGAFSDPTVIGDPADGDFYINVTSAGVRAGYWPTTGGAYIATASTVITAGVKYCIQVTLDSGILKCNVRGVGSNTLAAVNIAASSLARQPYLSNTYLGAHIDGRVAQVFTKNAALGSTDLDALYADAQASFGAL